jgi:hypothetical protein
MEVTVAACATDKISMKPSEKKNDNEIPPSGSYSRLGQEQMGVE